MIGKLRVALIFVSVMLSLAVLMPLQILVLLLEKIGIGGLAGFIPVLFHRLVLRLIGIRLHQKGRLSGERPLLIVANHVSWLDIVVVGAIAPLSFVAKAEMASWPLFGLLAKLHRTIFVKRERRRETSKQANDIANRMTAHEIIVLFPEGTTTDGNRLAPFKTPLFEAAKIALIASPVETAKVQPVAIEYSRLNGLPIGRSERPHVAWPGEIGLGESLIPLVREGALDVTLYIGEPILMEETSNRKIIAAQAASSIRDMLDSSTTPR